MVSKYSEKHGMAGKKLRKKIVLSGETLKVVDQAHHVLSPVLVDLSFSKIFWFPASNQVVACSFSFIVAYSHPILMSSLKS